MFTTILTRAQQFRKDKYEKSKNLETVEQKQRDRIANNGTPDGIRESINAQIASRERLAEHKENESQIRRAADAAYAAQIAASVRRRRDYEEKKAWDKAKPEREAERKRKLEREELERSIEARAREREVLASNNKGMADKILRREARENSHGIPHQWVLYSKEQRAANYESRRNS
jgi:hypothetical protein